VVSAAELQEWLPPAAGAAVAAAAAARYAYTRDVWWEHNYGLGAPLPVRLHRAARLVSADAGWQWTGGGATAAGMPHLHAALAWHKNPVCRYYAYHAAGISYT